MTFRSQGVMDKIVGEAKMRSQYAIAISEYAKFMNMLFLNRLLFVEACK